MHFVHVACSLYLGRIALDATTAVLDYCMHACFKACSRIWHSMHACVHCLHHSTSSFRRISPVQLQLQ